MRHSVTVRFLCIVQVLGTPTVVYEMEEELLEDCMLCAGTLDPSPLVRSHFGTGSRPASKQTSAQAVSCGFFARQALSYAFELESKHQQVICHRIAAGWLSMLAELLQAQLSGVPAGGARVGR